MSKALRALSVLAALCAVASVVLVVLIGVQDDQQLEDFINAPGAIEDFGNRAKTTEEVKDKVSPLLKHAMAFALRINPPPPPKPQKKAPSIPQVVKETSPERPKPKAPVTAKFKLLATCRYEQQPARSLALLDMPAKGIKWYRQGDDVGHLTIKEVKDGSVVCSDGQELFVPVREKKTKILLKSDLEALHRQQATISTPLEVEEKVIGVKEPNGALPAEPKDGSVERRRIRRLPPRKPRQLTPIEPTPEERKETLIESIDTIKEIMAQPDVSQDEEKAKEMKIWTELLQSLEEERGQIEESDK